MSDIVQRLRVEGFAVSAAVAYEAANEIERLRSRLTEVEALLREARVPAASLFHASFGATYGGLISRIDAFLTADRENERE